MKYELPISTSNEIYNRGACGALFNNNDLNSLLSNLDISIIISFNSRFYFFEASLGGLGGFVESN